MLQAVLYPTGNADEVTPHGDIPRVREDRLHRHIRGLETDAAALAVEALQGRLAFGLQPDSDGFAVVRRQLRLEDDEIAVVNERVHHRVPADAEREEAVGTARQHRG